MTFCLDEKNNNAEGYQTGVEILSARGGDKISTRLWWDKEGGNF